MTAESSTRAGQAATRAAAIGSLTLALNGIDILRRHFQRDIPLRKADVPAVVGAFEALGMDPKRFRVETGGWFDTKALQDEKRKIEAAMLSIRRRLKQPVGAGTPLLFLDLPPRSLRALTAAGVKTLGDIPAYERDRGSLLSLPSLGLQSFEFIRKRVEEVSQGAFTLR